MTQDHWNSIHAGRAADEFAWFEPVPSTLEYVVGNSTPDDPLIDVGGGASTLPIELIRRGYRDITVLDISDQALATSRAALWRHTDVVRWIHADIVHFEPARHWRIWHDRAAFHFLVDEADRSGYRSAAAAAVAPHGVLIVATFATSGPERCAGLPVRRCDVASLAAEFAPHFELLEGHALRPRPGTGDQRPYVVDVLRRTADPAVG